MTASGAPRQPAGPPPSAPADRTSTGCGPLAGLRVLEIASIGPGPMCGMLLADLGADVIRLDRLEPSGLGLALDHRFDVNARGRRSLALDLKHPRGRELALQLAARSDVLIEGFRPGVMEKLGLGPEDCWQLHPGLVYGRMTGFGQHGPLAQAAGHDLNYIALTGVLGAIGSPEAAPVPPLNLVGDYGGGAMFLAFGLLAALFERQSSGRGQVVDAAMVDGAAALASLFHGLRAAGRWGDERGRNLLDGGAPFYATYRTSDGGWISLAPLEPKFFAQLVQRLGLPAHFVQRQYDRRCWPELREAIAQAIARQSRAHWCETLEGSDVCFAPVLGWQEAAQHPHAQARGAYVEVDGITQPAPAPRFSRTPAGHPRPAPREGQHTDDLLAEVGIPQDEIEALRQGGVVR